jgi:mono/diheme cytochrome c family protein
MRTPLENDPRLDQAAVTDESLLVTHEKLLGRQPDERANYSLTPLVLLFVFSGLIFWAGTYLNRYAGEFDPMVFVETASPMKGEVVVAVQDPMKVGAAAYVTCAACHLPNGAGQPGIPPLAESEWVIGSEDRVVRILLYGLKGPIKVKGADYNGIMPPFGRVTGSAYNWSDEKVAAVLTYIRGSFGNTATPISKETVAAIRTKDGNHPEMTQETLQQLP